MKAMAQPLTRRVLLALVCAGGVWGVVGAAGLSCGSPTPCSPASCAGCCENDQCVVFSRQTIAACGTGGVECRACQSDQVCRDGRCLSDLMPNPVVDSGQPIVDGGPPTDAGPTCGGAQQPCCDRGGCFLGLFCNGGVCASEPFDAGPLPQDDGGVAPDPGTIGAGCTADMECLGNKCFKQVDAGASGCSGGCWPQGYCSQDCDGAACPSGSSCSPYLTSGVQWCLRHCDWDGGQGSCRPGYVCDRGLINTDPARATCIYRCGADGDCPSGTHCQSGFCCGKQGFACCGFVGGSCSTGSCNALGYCQ